MIVQLPNNAIVKRNYILKLILNDLKKFCEKKLHLPIYYKIQIYSKNDSNNYKF